MWQNLLIFYRNQVIVGRLDLDVKKLEEQASSFLTEELNQLFVGATSSNSDSEEKWKNRRRSFGLLLHITGIKQSQPHKSLKQEVRGGYTCSCVLSLAIYSIYTSNRYYRI